MLLIVLIYISYFQPLSEWPLNGVYRDPLFSKQLRMDLTRAQRVVLACCVLDYMAEYFKDEVPSRGQSQLFHFMMLTTMTMMLMDRMLRWSKLRRIEILRPKTFTRLTSGASVTINCISELIVKIKC